MGIFSSDEEDTYTRPYVVRCKDCEHWEKGDPAGICHNPNDKAENRRTSSKFYCADGERILKGWKCMTCIHSFRRDGELFCEKHERINICDEWCSDFERREEWKR